jgi:hypothetical protein
MMARAHFGLRFAYSFPVTSWRLEPIDRVARAAGTGAFHQPTRRPEQQVKQFKSDGQAQRLLSAHDQINNLFYLRRDHLAATEHRAARTQTFRVRAEISSIAATM